MNNFSDILSTHKLFENPSDPILLSFFILLLTFIILFSAKKKSVRKTLVINDVKSDKNHHLNAIKKFTKKYSNVTEMDFTGKLELDLNQAKEQYNRIILLSALRERPEDSQLLLYKSLQGAYKKNLMIFYLKLSKGKDFSLPDFEAAQVNLEPQDYTSQKINENLKTFLNTSFLEEFKRTIWIFMALILVIFVIIRLSPIEDTSQGNSNLDIIITKKNNTDINSDIVPDIDNSDAEISLYGECSMSTLQAEKQIRNLLKQIGISKFLNFFIHL